MGKTCIEKQLWHPWEMDMGLVRPVCFVDERADGLKHRCYTTPSKSVAKKPKQEYTLGQTGIIDVERFYPDHLVDRRADGLDNLSYRKIQEDPKRKIL